MDVHGRVTWPDELLATDIGKMIKDPVTGGILFAGLRAKCSIFHGPMSKIVPHTTTGKGDAGRRLPQASQTE